MLRYLGRALAVILLAVAILAVAALIFTDTAAFNRQLHDKTVSYLNTTYRGHFSIAKVEGSVWSRLKLGGVTAAYGGHRIAHVAQVSVSVTLISLLWGSLHVEVDIDRPRIRLARLADGNWNLLDAVSDRNPAASSSAPMPFAVVFDRIGIRGGTVRIFPRGDPGPNYDLAGLGFDGSLRLTRAGTRAGLRRLETTVSARGLPPMHVRAALAYQNERQPATVRIARIELTTQNSALALSGNVRLAQVMAVETEIRIHKLAATDLARIYPASPLIADLSGTLGVKGPADALRAQIALAAGGASITGVAGADIVSKTPRYSAKLTLAHAAIARLIRAGGASGLIDATLDAHGAGLNLGAATAHLTLNGKDVAATRYKLGKIGLNADLAHEALSARLMITAPAGQLTAAGTATLAANPHYRFAVAAQKLDVANVRAARAKGAATPTDINFHATIDGQGLKPASMNTRITGIIGVSRMGPVSVNRGTLDVRIAHARADIAQFDLAGQGATVAVSGYAGLRAGAPSRINYQLRARDASGLLRLVHQKGGGSIYLAGTISGPSSALRAHGTAAMEKLSFASYSVGRGQIRYDLTATGAEAPYGDATAELSDVAAGVRLRTLATQIQIARGTPRAVAFSLSAEDNAGHRDDVAADFTYQPKLIRGRLTRLTLNVPAGQWRLVAPAAFRRDPGGIALERMELRSGDRAFVAQGTLANSGQQNFQLELRRFDLAALEPLMPGGRKLSGTLSARASVAGTGAAPNVYLETEMRQVYVQSQPIGDFSSAIRYQQRQTTVDAVLERGANGRLTVNGTIPMALGWASGFRMTVGNGIDLRIKSARLNLAQLGALEPRDVRNLHGALGIDLALRGSLSRLAPDGSVRITGVRGRIVPLGVTVSEMHAVFEITPEQVRIAAMEAHAGKGSLIATGAIGLNGYNPGSGGVEMSFNRWPAIDTQQYQATLGGHLAADGTLTAPRVRGALTVLNGIARPDLAFLTASAPMAPDETITVIPAGAKVALPEHQGGPPPLPPPPPKQPPSTYNAMALEVTVAISRDTWIRDQYANAELEGSVQIDKKPYGPTRLVGAVHTVRGWVEYQARRFTLQTGTVEFTGGREINPTLDFDAQYLVTNYTIDILIGGTADKPTITFKSVPELSQADILSLVLFGKTTSALGKGQQAALQQQAAQMAAGYAAQKVGQAVANSLGLQGMGFELSGVSTSGGSVGFGHYLGSNTYVSASENLGNTSTSTNTAPGKVSVQYSILPWLAVTTSTFSDGSREIDLTFTRRY